MEEFRTSSRVTEVVLISIITLEAQDSILVVEVSVEISPYNKLSNLVVSQVKASCL
jgi:hypothetical protein